MCLSKSIMCGKENFFGEDQKNFSRFWGSCRMLVLPSHFVDVKVECFPYSLFLNRPPVIEIRNKESHKCACQIVLCAERSFLGKPKNKNLRPSRLPCRHHYLADMGVQIVFFLIPYSLIVPPVIEIRNKE